MAAVTSPFESALDELARERRALDAAEAAWLASVAAYERSREWQAEGFLSAAAALRERCRMTHGAASSVLRFARRLERLPHTAAAFAAGRISRQHAKVIADAYTVERAAEFEAGEHEFAAAAENLHADDLRDLVKYATDSIDGDGGARADAQQYQHNRFHVSPLADRVAADGSLDRESGEIVMTALDAMGAELHPDRDRRDRSVRHAEALTEICRRSLGADHRAPSDRRRGRPHVSAIVDVRLFERERGSLVADIRAEAEHVGRLSRTTLERLTCDCEISRVVTDGPSEIIDVGRTTRNIPPKLWKALVVRDRHCRAPGCDRPPAWCEAHHVRHWSRGGPTDLDNLELLCWAHHRQQHHHDAKKRE